MVSPFGAQMRSISGFLSSLALRPKPEKQTADTSERMPTENALTGDFSVPHFDTQSKSATTFRGQICDISNQHKQGTRGAFALRRTLC